MRSRQRTTMATITTVGVALGLVIATPLAASADTFTVTSTADSGPGTLRQAIIDANASPAVDTIDFSLGAGPYDISLTTSDTASSVLPAITDAVTIDATAIDDWAPDNPQLQIIAGDDFDSASTFTIDADDVSISGVTIASNSFDGFSAGFRITGDASDATIEYNQMGTNLAGTEENGYTSPSAVLVQGSSGHTIANNFFGNVFTAIDLQAGSDDTVISGNTLGFGRDGEPLIINRGVNLSGVSGITVSDNVIVGHAGSNAGVALIEGGDVAITGNIIGVRPNGTGDFSGRTGGGILVAANSNPVTNLQITGNTIKNGNSSGMQLLGGTPGIGGLVTDNVIHDTGNNGIRAFGAVLGQLELGGNSITENPAMGIDTLSQFPNINSPDAPPDITAAVGGVPQVDIDYDGPGGVQQATLYLSKNPTCDADTEGETPFSVGTLALDASGDFTGTVPVQVAPSIGDNLTAIITPTTGISTEYSDCFAVATGTNAPGAVSQNLATGVDVPLPITVAGTDLDDEALTFALDATPSHGSLNALGAPDCSASNTCTSEVTYTPVPGYEGTDSFTYTVNDGTSTSAPATVTIDVSDESADINVTSFNAAPDEVTQGGGIALIGKLRNLGPSVAADTLVRVGNLALDELPAGTTYVGAKVTSSTEDSGTCSWTPGGPVECLLGSGDLQPNDRWTVTVYLDTTSSPLGELEAKISAVTPVDDPNPDNDQATTTTIVIEPTADETKEYVPPSDEPITVATAEVILRGNTPTPVAEPGDTTAAAVVVPPGGPGGRVVINELDCELPFCPTTLARPIAPAPLEPPIDNKVIQFIPPSSSYYDYRHRVRYVVSYDRTTVVGVNKDEVTVLYTKEGDPTLYQAVPCVRPFTAEAEFPCIGGVQRLKSSNVALKRDLRVVLVATYDDPKAGTYR